jgi:hypothetical protein
MTCSVKARLERRFNQVGEMFATGRERLLDKLPACSQAESLALTDEVNRACDLLDDARSALDLHIRKHACSGEEDTAAAQSKQSSSCSA